MIRNYLKVTLRNLMKNKVFFIINVLGLGIAIACSIVAYLNYDYSKKFDVEHVNADKIYRIGIERNFNDRLSKRGYSPRGMSGVLKENAPDPKKVIRFMSNGANVKIEDDLFNANITYVDEGFFDMFTFPLISGNYDLSDQSKIYLEEELAIKYFGDTDPVGQQITHVLDSGFKDYTVGGVFETKPSNSSFMFIKAFTTYDNYFNAYPQVEKESWSEWNLTFVEFENPEGAKAFEAELQQYIEPQNKAREDFQVTKYFVEPLVGMAERSQSEEIYSWLRMGNPPASVVAPLIMALLLLLLACFNFTNTSIAISGRRLKEIGLRKVMGGLRSQLIVQFLTENILICLIALFAGLVMAEFLVPAYGEMWDFLELQLDYANNLGLLGFIFVTLIATGIIAGSYPAFYVSKFEPTSILKRTQKFGGAGIFSKVLLVFQFTIAVLAIISAVAFIQNAQYQKDFDLGFEGEGVLHVNFNDPDDLLVYKNTIENNSLVKEISLSKHQIMDYRINDPIRFEENEIESDILEVDENYLSTMNIGLIEGRNFEKDSETDRRESAIVSTKFKEKMGWDNAVGKRLVWRDTVQLYVIGEMENVYMNALWAPLEPCMLRLSDEEYRFISVQVDPLKEKEGLAYLEGEWKTLFPNKLFTGDYFNLAQTEAALVNNNILTMFLFLGIIAALLAVSGLYTLVALNIIRRMKEIAVRKVLGASIGSVAVKLNIPFVIILLISSILGSFASYYMVGGLFSSIWTYHVDLNIVVFAISAIIMLIISIATVGYKVFSAASTNPASTLRNE